MTVIVKHWDHVMIKQCEQSKTWEVITRPLGNPLGPMAIEAMNLPRETQTFGLDKASAVDLADRAEKFIQSYQPKPKRRRRK